MELLEMIDAADQEESLVFEEETPTEASTPPPSPTAMIHLLATPTAGQEDQVPDAIMHDTTEESELPMPLKFLFALNGFTLAFPTTALLYIVNTRVEMSISLLPAYGAVAFLPNSLRPLYAYLSQKSYRDRLYSALLVLCAVSYSLTALVPRNGLVLCFVVAFLRGVATSWPEFLLGLTLVDLARSSRTDYDKTCAVFQSQAATARGIGSLMASIGAFGLVSQHESLKASTMNVLLFIPAMANLVGAGIGLYYKIGRQRGSAPISPCCVPHYQSISTQDEEVGDSAVPNNATSSDSWCVGSTRSHNVRLVVLLQITVVLFALQTPLKDVLSPIGWQAGVSTSCVALILSFAAAVWTGKWGRSQKVGLFLILRHLIPSVSYLFSAYLYDIFATAPYLLQLMHFVDMFISTAATWSYGKFWSRFSSDAALPLLILGMTLLNAFVSLSQVWLVHILPGLKGSPWIQFGLVIAIQAIVGLTGMWSFMPDVVLATTAVKHTSRREGLLSAHSNHYEQVQSGQIEEPHTESSESIQERHTRNMHYGTLISCLDFGDQLGALVLGSLVVSLGVTREYNWDHLDDLIQYCALLGACSAVLIFIIR